METELPAYSIHADYDDEGITFAELSVGEIVISGVTEGDDSDPSWFPVYGDLTPEQRQFFTTGVKGQIFRDDAAMAVDDLLPDIQELLYEAFDGACRKCQEIHGTKGT